MKAIIIDDEHSARVTLQGLLEAYCPAVQILTVCQNAEEGIKAINTLKPQLVFLDVELQTMKGFELLEMIGFPNIPFEVIFCTGHDHYAVQAFRYSAIGFLLKPIHPKYLTAAVIKAQEQISDKQRLAHYETLRENLLFNTNQRMVLPTNDGLLIVQINEIIRLSSVKEKGMTQFLLTKGRTIMVRKNLGEYDDLAPFLRVHKTDSVNPIHIMRYQKNGWLELTDGFKIEVPTTRREDVINWLNNMKP